MNALEQLKALRRDNVHGGYRWMAVLSDGECICEACVTKEYEHLFPATYRAVIYGPRFILEQDGDLFMVQH